MRVLSADANGAAFSTETDEEGTVAVIILPRLDISLIAVIE
jgi:hypothetical protein